MEAQTLQNIAEYALESASKEFDSAWVMVLAALGLGCSAGPYMYMYSSLPVRMMSQIKIRKRDFRKTSPESQHNTVERG